MNRVAGKVALVTGGASGIGLSAATLLSEEGAAVVIADYNIKGARDAAADLQRRGKLAQAVFLDASEDESIQNASEDESIQNAVTFTVETYGKLNILFNNVGLTNLQKDLDVVAMDLEEWDRLMNVNVKSVLLGARYAIPHMKEAGGGSIINTASMSAFAGDSIRSAYGTSKAAVVQLTKYIATQYGKDLIRCNAIAPGLILTPAAKANMSPSLLATFEKYNALPYHGEANDIGHAVVYLASDESKFMTGQTLQIEGGHYIGNPTSPDFLAMQS